MWKKTFAVLFVFLAIYSVFGAKSGCTSFGDKAFEHKAYTTAFICYHTAAWLGDPKAQLKLGKLYLNGLGVPQDCQKALKWIKLASDKKESDAYFQLGLLYQEGICVDADLHQSVLYYKKACDSGNKCAQFLFDIAPKFKVGTFLPWGAPPPQPVAEAIKKATQAANSDGQAEEANTIFLKALDQFPENATLHSVYGNFLFNFFRETSLDSAENQLRTAIEIDPMLYSAHYDLGRILGAKKMWTESADEGAKAGMIRLLSEQPEFLKTILEVK